KWIRTRPAAIASRSSHLKKSNSTHRLTTRASINLPSPAGPDPPSQNRQSRIRSVELQDTTAIGLCPSFVHAQLIQSSKGSRFLLCGLSKTDPRFPKYPRLPVLACSGYQKQQTKSTDLQ